MTSWIRQLFQMYQEINRSSLITQGICHQGRIINHITPCMRTVSNCVVGDRSSRIPFTPCLRTVWVALEIVIASLGQALPGESHIRLLPESHGVNFTSFLRSYA